MDEEEIGKRFEEIERRLLELEKSPRKLEAVAEVDVDIFDIEGEKLILTRITGEKTSDKIQNISLLVLLGCKRKLGQEKVRSSIMKENVAIHGIPLENFATHLKKLIPQSILRVGKATSPTACYKLTTFGEARAKRLLEEILENE